jgi:hypothetical protein
MSLVKTMYPLFPFISNVLVPSMIARLWDRCNRLAALVVILVFGSISFAYGKDKASTYQLGTYLSADKVSDGTNQVMLYRLQIDSGVWVVETDRQVSDTFYKKNGVEPFHFKPEKYNPLDLLNNGAKVLFRVKTHKGLLGTLYYVFIPYADNPNKEVEFSAHFKPNVAPALPYLPSDNVKAMCDSHKLSPELETKFCQVTR